MTPTGLVFARRIKCDEGRAFAATVGATAVVRGQLVKFSAATIVTMAADDKQLDAYLVINGAAAAGTCLVIPLRSVDYFEIATSATPTVGAAYGIDDGLTLDQSDTTNKLLVVQAVDTGKATALVSVYMLTS